MKISTAFFGLGLCIEKSLGARHNPLIPGFNPDPSPVFVDGWYFLATSSFEYFPGIPIYRSQDLSNWELYSHALTTASLLPLYGTPTTGGAWAPTLSFNNGSFYLTSMTRWTYDPVAKVWPRMSWVTSKNLKQWSEPVWGEPWGIDPQLYHDPQSGKSYLNLMAPNNNKDRLWGISQCEVDLGTGNCVGSYRSLWNGTLPQTSNSRPEGPKMLFRDGYHYLLIAEGGTDLLHRATISRSKSPEGPWESAPNNPLLYNGETRYGNLTVQSTGHGTIIDTPDKRSYMIYLARRNVNGSSPLGRETFISSVEWKNGWPIVNGGGPVLLSEGVKGLPDKRPGPFRVTETFNKEKLDIGWYTLRTPYTQIYSLARRDRGRCVSTGGLTFAPNVFDLSDRDVPAAILRRQTSLNMSFSALTYPLPVLSPGQAVGISAYLSELTHHDIAYGRCRNTTGTCIYASLIRNGTEIYNETPFTNVGEASVEFHIRAEPLKYSLGFRAEGQGTVKWLASFAASWMAFAPKDWLVFEGAMFALFATGKGQPWTTAGPTVGFCKTEESFHEELIPDLDVW